MWRLALARSATLSAAAGVAWALCPVPPRVFFTPGGLLITALWYLPLPWLVATALLALFRRRDSGFAATAWWFGPLAILARSAPEGCVVAVVLWTLHLTTVVVQAPLGSHRPLAVLSAVSLQGVVMLIALERPLSAAALATVPAAIFARGFAPLALPWKRTLAALALLLLALIPLGSFLQRPVESTGAGRPKPEVPRADEAPGTRDDSTKDQIHRGVILWPPREKTRPPAPPRPVLSRSQSLAQPPRLRIPFQGVYWFFPLPLSEPPPLSLTEEGVPTEKSYRSTHGRAMVMEAHQHLGARYELSCCGRIDVEVGNGEAIGQGTQLELVLRDTKQRILAGVESGPGVLSLGRVPVESRPEGRVAAEVLKFPVRPSSLLSGFDAITVRYHRPPLRRGRHTRIDIRALVLIAPGR